MRQQHELQQGTPEWHQFRAAHFGASEAAAMMGLSPYTARAELLKQKATGAEQEVSPQLQAVFDRGHETEIGGRSLAESIIGEELYPVVMSLGQLSASCDGLTMDESIAFEHKQFSASLAESIANGVLPDHHQPQCQQVMHVTGATRCLFMTSDGTESKCAWMWVERDESWIDRIVAGWTQFATDLAAYQPVEVVREAVAAPQETLPAVSVQVTGSIAVIDNLNVFGDALTQYVGKINKAPQTDDDFATLEAQVKVLKGAEDALTAAENNALGQAADIDALRRAVANYKEVARQARLTAEKVVKAEKENRKNAIIAARIEAFYQFKIALEKQFPPALPMVMPDVACDFHGAAKGLKTIASIQNAADTELARAKIAAESIAGKIARNISRVAEQTEHRMLFSDYRILAVKDPEYVDLEIDRRITAYKMEQERKLVVERERIEFEARQKAEREARAKVEAEQRELAAKNAAEQKKADDEAAAKCIAPIIAAEIAARRPEPVDAKAVAEAPIHDETALRNEIIGVVTGVLTLGELRKVAHYIDRLMNERAKAT